MGVKKVQKSSFKAHYGGLRVTVRWNDVAIVQRLETIFISPG